MTLPLRTRSWRGVALRIGGSALTLAVLFLFLPVGQVWQAMKGVPPGLWVVVLAGYMCLHVLAVVKWRLMVNLAGAELGFAQAAHCYFAGLFGNVFLPSIVGGDVLRAGLGYRLGRNRAGVILGSLLDRVWDMVALAGVAAAGTVLLSGMLDARGRNLFWSAVAGITIAGAVAIALVWAVLRRRFSFRMRRRLVKLRQAARSMRRRPQYVVLALSFSHIIQAGFVLLMASLAPACGLVVALRVWLFAYPLAKLSALLPVTQGGIGVREAMLVVLLVPFGPQPETVFAAGLVWESVVIVGGLLGGLLSLLTRRAAPAERESPEKFSAVGRQDQLTAPRTGFL